MSIKNKRKQFNKKQFLCSMKKAYCILARANDYKIFPPMIETKLPHNTIMSATFRQDGKGAILYDYQKFTKRFGKQDVVFQEAMVGNCVAHEFRHVYQVNQVFSKKSNERKGVLRKWKQNIQNYKSVDNGFDFDEYKMQPIEIDANLYSYLFSAQVYDVILPIGDKKQYNATKRLYKKYCGKLDKSIFNRQAKGLCE